MSDPAFINNPWSAEHWNLTRQGQYVRKYGVEVAKTKAKMAGTTLNGPRPAVLAATPAHKTTIIVQRRNVVTNFPQGYAGIGPPDPNL